MRKYMNEQIFSYKSDRVGCIIYKIESPSGEMYVGSTSNGMKRWSQHRSQLRNGKHHCKPLQRAYDKYSECYLFFEILEYVRITDKQIEIEQWWIDKLQPKYNVCKEAGKPDNSLESIVKTREFNKGRNHTEDHKRKISESGKGRIVSQETRDKLSAIHKGKIVSQETRNKLSDSLKGRTATNKGIPHTEATKRKMSEVRKLTLMNNA